MEINFKDKPYKLNFNNRNFDTLTDICNYLYGKIEINNKHINRCKRTTLPKLFNDYMEIKNHIKECRKIKGNEIPFNEEWFEKGHPIFEFSSDRHLVLIYLLELNRKRFRALYEEILKYKLHKRQHRSYMGLVKDIKAQITMHLS